MTENNHTGFSHIMPSASEHAWQEDLYQGVSEKIPADIIAEIFGSVSPNVKNLSGGNELFLSNPLDEARKIGLID